MKRAVTETEEPAPEEEEYDLDQFLKENYIPTDEPLNGDDDDTNLCPEKQKEDTKKGVCEKYWTVEGPNEYVTECKFGESYPSGYAPNLSHFRRWARPFLLGEEKRNIIEGKQFPDKPNSLVSTRLVVIGCKSAYVPFNNWQKRFVPVKNEYLDHFSTISGQSSYHTTCDNNDDNNDKDQRKLSEYLETINNNSFPKILQKISDTEHSRLSYITDLTSCSTGTITDKDIHIPIIHLFCLDDEGHSYCINVHGFFPYLYTDLPKNVPELFDAMKEEMIDEIEYDNSMEACKNFLCTEYATRLESWLDNSEKYKKKKREGEHQNDIEKDSDVIIVGDSGNYEETTEWSQKSWDELQALIEERNQTTDTYLKRPHYSGRRTTGYKNQPEALHKRVFKVEIVKRTPVAGGHKEAEYKFKITFIVPSIIPGFRKRMKDEGIKMDLSFMSSLFNQYLPSAFSQPWDISKTTLMGDTYDSCIRFENRFLIDTGLHGGCWFDILQDSPKVVRFLDEITFQTTLISENIYNTEKSNKSRCQVEIDLHYSDLKVFNQYEPSDQFMYNKTISNVRVMSFDIECIGKNYRFPGNSLDPIICINVYATKDIQYPTIFSENQSDYSKEPKIKDKVLSICFAVGPSNYVPQSHKKILRGYGDVEPAVFTFKSESDMLKSFFSFITIFDADIITGFNTSKFDIPYVIERSKKLGLDSSFERCTRLINDKIKSQVILRQHKKNGSTSFVNQECSGRLCWDTLPFVVSTYKLSSYTLNNICEKWFNQKKDDLNHETIPIYYRSGNVGRDIVRTYCEKDAYLAMRIFIQKQVWLSKLEECRTKGIRLEQAEDSQSQKSFPFLQRFANKMMPDHYCIPYEFFQDGEEIKCEGAIVQDPVIGLHDEYVVCLGDYASEYPCQIRAENLCQSTYIPPEQRDYIMKKYGKDCCNISPTTNHWFLKKEYREGIYAKAETFLMEARSKVRGDMKKYSEGSEIYDVLNVRQGQIKISANGLFGLLITKHNGLWWWRVGESVTDYARRQIENTVKILHRERNDIVIIYGDTDSIFYYMREFKIDYSWPREKQDEVLKAAQKEHIRLCAIITKEMHAPNVFMPEYIAVTPMLLLSKKKYSLKVVEKVGGKITDKTSGVEGVRRSTCIFTAVSQQTVIDLLTVKMDKVKAIEYALEQTIKLAQGKVNPVQLIISGKLNKIPECEIDEKTVSEAQYIYQRIKMVDPNGCPNVGDRIPYLITTADSKERYKYFYQRAVQPREVVGKNAKRVDYEYYFNNKFLKPIVFVLSVVDKNIESKMMRVFQDNFVCSENPEFSSIEPNDPVLVSARHSLGITQGYIPPSSPSSSGTLPITDEELVAVSDLNTCDEYRFYFDHKQFNLGESGVTKMNTKDLKSFFSHATKCIVCKTRVSTSTEVLYSLPKDYEDNEKRLFSVCFPCFEHIFRMVDPKDPQSYKPITEKMTFSTMVTKNSESYIKSMTRISTMITKPEPNIPVVPKTPAPKPPPVTQKKPGRRRRGGDLLPGETVKEWKWNFGKKETSSSSSSSSSSSTEITTTNDEPKVVDMEDFSIDVPNLSVVTKSAYAQNAQTDDKDITTIFSLMKNGLRENLLDKKIKNGTKIWRTCKETVFSLIKNDLNENILKQIENGKKVWQTCKDCMKEKFSEAACSNTHCDNWFLRNFALRDCTIAIKQKEDLFPGTSDIIKTC